MSILAIALLAQLAAPGVQPPALAFPEPGIDDTAAYRGYQTRFFRDAARNTVQIYLDRREARVVHLWANAENESIGFSARDAAGRAAALDWGGPGIEATSAGGSRLIEYALVARTPRLSLGHFLLGSMRVERDFQAWGHHRQPYAGPRFVLPEMGLLLRALAAVPPAERARHVALLGAPDVATLQARLQPTITTRATATAWSARIVQPSLDARDTLVLEIAVDPRRVAATRAGDAVSLRARAGARVPFTVRISTTGEALTPLAREEIFTPEFLAFVADARTAATAAGARDSAAIRARWLERQVTGVELLSSREKLMAGLPTYATYFGRDMLVSALMMRPIWRDDMSAYVVGAMLRKLSPTGQVSHEEALGGQAVREAAAEYASLVDARAEAARAGDGNAADSLGARATAVLRDMRRVRENYHMIDDELQLAVLAARWLGDERVPAGRKREFLLDTADGGGTRLARLVRELALVSRMTEAYARDAVVTNLIPFAARDSSRWAATSWRDSGVGYANGKYAMDVNAIWAPHALESIGRILDAVRGLGFDADTLARQVPELAPTTTLGRWARDPQALRAATDAWWGASRHFLVRLAPDSVRARVGARLLAMPAVERAHWTRVLAATGAARDSLTFLALALDASGRPIGVANSDPATRLFLGERAGRGARDTTTMQEVLRDVRLFGRAYPVGLFIDGVGPVVANDAYASPAVWQAFVRDAYHGPRVAWGREVNLFLLGVAGHVAAAGDTTGDPARAAYVRELRTTAERVQAAVEASGFQSELWSYDFVNGRPRPVRYGSGADIQLWSTTDLVVQWALSRLR